MIKNQPADLEQIPIEEICRDENCPVVEIHRTHPVVRRRGRSTDSCPNCFRTLRRVTPLTLVCSGCGWSRTKDK